jgi:hypothetical protein
MSNLFLLAGVSAWAENERRDHLITPTILETLSKFRTVESGKMTLMSFSILFIKTLIIAILR